MAEHASAGQNLIDDEALDPEVEAQIDAALEAARNAPPSHAATNVEYLVEVRILIVHLNNGQRLLLPVEDVQELADATDEQLSEIELLGPGTGIHFPRFDGNLYVPYLVEGSRGNDRWERELEEKRAAAMLSAA